MSVLSLTPIATVYSPFKEKFAIPRQPGLATAAKGEVVLFSDFNHSDYVRELTQFSHIWLIFVFHASHEQGFKSLVRPPRLGGNKKVGVFASRSTFRPNPIGMSVVKLDEISYDSNQTILHISGLDLLDKTPIIDIKPYVPYSDALVDATAGFANTKPSNNKKIDFSEQAKNDLNIASIQQPELKLLIEQVLQQDPRPAYKQNKLDVKIYGMSLYDFNIQWQMKGLDEITVLTVTKTSQDNAN